MATECMTIKLLTEHHLEFLNSKGGCRGSSEPTHVKIPHCWKPHNAARLRFSLFNWQPPKQGRDLEAFVNRVESAVRSHIRPKSKHDNLSKSDRSALYNLQKREDIE